MTKKSQWKKCKDCDNYTFLGEQCYSCYLAYFFVPHPRGWGYMPIANRKYDYAKKINRK
jgi:hypothetical protein